MRRCAFCREELPLSAFGPRYWRCRLCRANVAIIRRIRAKVRAAAPDPLAGLSLSGPIIPGALRGSL